MAETAEAHPSVKGISGILARVPEDRLVHYKHKLSCLREDRRSCQLLHAMILLTLRREAEAQMSLEALRGDAAAAHIYRSHRGSAKANGANPIPPEQEAEVALAVAQIYSLLVDEKLCSPWARDEAYRDAIKAFQASGIQSAKLKSVWDEALNKCGPDFMPTLARGHFGAPRSDTGRSPPLAARSSPVPINRSSDPSDLRSTGSPVSLISHFAISQSLTVPFLTQPVNKHSVPETGKPYGCASSPSATVGKGGADFDSLDNCYSVSPEESSAREDQPQNRRPSDSHSLVPSNLNVLRLPEEVAQHPVRCTEHPNTGPQDLGGSVPPNRQPASTWRRGSGASAGCVERGVGESSSSTLSTGPGGHSSSSSAPPPPPPTGSSSTNSLGDEKQFFTFMVLHTSEDEAIACRVKERLEALGVSNGATFCEDFLIPGHPQLSCFQDALDNSAFTLLLLTENFKGRLCAYQTSVALMDSFTRYLKTHSVIPFVPKEYPLKRAEMPTLLLGLVPLDENSPVFAKRVTKTFTATAVREKKDLWSCMRETQERERHREYLQAVQHLSTLGISSQAPMTFPAPQAGFAGVQAHPGHAPQPFFHQMFPTPGMSQPPPGPDQPSLSQPFMVSMSGGPQPHLIIQNAQMVQIGDYNHMQVEKTNATLGTADEEAGADWRMGDAAGNRHRD